ncbi:hypothetical protein [Eubacterium limosum]|uniref:hypothetical protein n=1 Tax=Eubacterium limosum TaxID=1736 RepID=UPI001063FE30|nr:hypothetical protein [Eubacterium limosum]
MKYKTGDKVRIRKDLNCGIKCYSNVIEEMLPFAGKEAMIMKASPRAYMVDADRGKFFWNDEMFECDFKIEGFRSNNATVCLMKKDGKVIAKGIAKCCPEDDYDFEFGIRLAFFRMMGLPTDEMLHESEDRESTGRFENNELVRVTDTGCLYDTYGDFVLEFAPEMIKHFTYGKGISGYEQKKDVFKILTQHNHLTFGVRHLLIIQNVRTNDVYVIGEESVERFDLEAIV